MSGMVSLQVVNTFVCVVMPSDPDDEFFGIQSLRRQLSAPAILSAAESMSQASKLHSSYSSEDDNLSLPRKKFRPCKGQRHRYCALVQRTLEQITADPVGFDLSLLESQLPHSITKYAPLKTKFMTRMRQAVEEHCNKVNCENSRISEGSTCNGNNSICAGHADVALNSFGSC